MDGTTDDTTELLSISAFARRVGLAPSALRFYDDCRVLRPARVDAATGYRSYTPDQETRARLLRSLREAGLPLAEVTVVLDGPAPAARAVLEEHRATVRDRSRTADATIAAVLRSLSPAGGGASTRVRLGGPELAGAVRQVVPAVGHDAAHPVLGCVLVEIDDGEVRLVATDRYRLSMRVLRPAAVDGPACRLLVESAALTGTGAWAARRSEVTVEVGQDGARATDASGSEFRDLVVCDGRFPSYREMLSALAPPAHRVIVDRQALLDAVSRRGDTPGIALVLGDDEVVVSLPDGSGATRLPAVRPDEQPLRIGFDPAVLAPALEASIGPDVLLEISTATQPVVVRSADQGSFTTLVMPISLTPGNGNGN
ncbi:MerR family transcriptional regulator [Streptomyces sp. NPDC058200]|uniref:DNA polymerase III subunit beta family protein n=1 Tax=Streptomyces sp. NPDC058200 TaxID=3346378 RepID=UPI0036E19E98